VLNERVSFGQEASLSLTFLHPINEKEDVAAARNESWLGSTSKTAFAYELEV
jgi:hypothetical protein